ncbi:hypothetical protein FQN53_006723 [Emmonsiellopsis sp. PD_33]|nr:hypothetical protein FQN53_006723 [Emmonsiellopsis sp. PD_33]
MLPRASLLAALLAAAAQASSRACRCLPADGDVCWPSDQLWARFNQSIDGRLVTTVPLGAPCHEPNYDAAACDALREAWQLPEVHYESSSSVMAPFFANGTCDPYHPVSTPCTLGNYVVYAVNVSKPEHISTALRFATKHNIRIVTRNTGHDYQGKSTGAGALGIWLHNLKNIDIHDYHDAHYSGKAITMGAGVQGFEAYEAADRAGLQVVGGECPTVGMAGGYAQGGGHSALSSRYGLAADQVLQWDVVDGRGNLISATRDNKFSDLYWALSGGGGGTYGVVWSVTSKAHAATPVSGLNLTFTNTAEISKDTFYEAVTRFHAALPAIVDSGAMAIWFFTSSSFIISPITGPDITKEALVSLIEPFTKALTDIGIKYTMDAQQFPSYLTQFNTMQGEIGVGEAQYGGWLIPRSVVQTDNDALTAACRHIVEDGATFIGVGLNVSRAVTGDVHNAVFPGWRDALIHVTLTTPWKWNANEEMVAMQRKMTEDYVPKLAALAPDAGAYLNEADFRQPDFQKAFYGSNYGKLLGIKAKYDPHSIFYGRTAVGSEAWVQEDDGRLCRARGRALSLQQSRGNSL